VLNDGTASITTESGDRKPALCKADKNVALCSGRTFWARACMAAGMSSALCAATGPIGMTFLGIGIVAGAAMCVLRLALAPVPGNAPSTVLSASCEFLMADPAPSLCRPEAAAAAPRSLEAACSPIQWCLRPMRHPERTGTIGLGQLGAATAPAPRRRGVTPMPRLPSGCSARRSRP